MFVPVLGRVAPTHTQQCLVGQRSIDTNFVKVGLGARWRAFLQEIVPHRDIGFIAQGAHLLCSGMQVADFRKQIHAFLYVTGEVGRGLAVFNQRDTDVILTVREPLGVALHAFQ